MQSSVLFYGGIEDDQYLENSTRISYDAENNVNVDLLASDTVDFFMSFAKLSYLCLQFSFILLIAHEDIINSSIFDLSSSTYIEFHSNQIKVTLGI